MTDGRTDGRTDINNSNWRIAYLKAMYLGMQDSIAYTWRDAVYFTIINSLLISRRRRLADSLEFRPRLASLPAQI